MLMILSYLIPGSLINTINLKDWLFMIGGAILATLSYIIYLLERLVRAKEIETPASPNVGANTYKE
jgi:hypothetical protein